VNAYTVLQDHHKVLKGLVHKITSTPAAAPERQEYLDDLLVELDIHFRTFASRTTCTTRLCRRPAR
jgi:hypothetical protein